MAADTGSGYSSDRGLYIRKSFKEKTVRQRVLYAIVANLASFAVGMVLYNVGIIFSFFTGCLCLYLSFWSRSLRALADRSIIYENKYDEQLKRMKTSTYIVM
ncbi:MAG: hypothetical protein R2881_03195 [Eubacteriales bacterium]